jgi:uncharacterized membrane protein
MRGVSRALAPIAFAFALACVALLVIAPLLPAALAAPIYGIGSLVCHQRPERSFHLAGIQLPVCGRCLGIYAGAAFGLIVPLRRVDRARRALSIAALPTIITLVVEWTGLADPGNVLRAAAGAILGAGVVAVVVTLHYDECAQRRPIVSSPRRPPI